MLNKSSEYVKRVKIVLFKPFKSFVLDELINLGKRRDSGYGPSIELPLSIGPFATG